MYKVLLCGRGKTVVNDFFTYLGVDYELQTTSVRESDMLCHLKYYMPDALVFCLQNEEDERMAIVTDLRKRLEELGTVLVLVGSADECLKFQKKSGGLAGLVLKKPIHVRNVGKQLAEFLEQRKAEAGVEAEIPVPDAGTVGSAGTSAEGNNMNAGAGRVASAAGSSSNVGTGRTAGIAGSSTNTGAVRTASTAGNTGATSAAGVGGTGKTASAARPAGSTGTAGAAGNTGAEQAKSAAAIRAAIAAKAAAAGLAANQGEGPAKKHVLVVDDDPMILKLIKEHLKDTYNVGTAINGSLALKFLETKKTDLILMDYEMPGETGADVLEKIRNNPATAALPVIFLTGISSREVISKVMSLKPQGYMLKPIDRDTLLQTIAKKIGN